MHQFQEFFTIAYQTFTRTTLLLEVVDQNNFAAILSFERGKSDFSHFFTFSTTK